jgi:hypothetical protein
MDGRYSDDLEGAKWKTSRIGAAVALGQISSTIPICADLELLAIMWMEMLDLGSDLDQWKSNMNLSWAVPFQSQLRAEPVLFIAPGAEPALAIIILRRCELVNL